jgi:glycosyltransferase involved in cell wall biosynthesis
MRVLMVADGMWNGGAERQLALLASSLPEPWTASVLAMEDGPYRPVLEGLGIDVKVVPRRFRLDATVSARMWREMSAVEPDVLHSWGYMSTLAVSPYCRIRRVPLLHGAIRLGCLPPGGVFWFRAGLSLSDAVVANSRAGLATFGVPEGERGRVVYNGFDPDRLARVPARAADAERRRAHVIIMAARMHPEKDWRLLLGAVRVLARDTPGLTLVAVGGGFMRDELMAEAADLIAADIVRFPEGGLEVLPMIADADIGVLLTDPALHAEGCSNSIMEYMACGLPVVCTDSGGNAELVEDGVTGLLVPPRDVNALVAALRTVIDDPVRAREMGEKGRQRLQEDFTVDAMVAGFVDAYECVMHERGGR